METTKKNEPLTESAKIAEKWFSDVNSIMMDIYKNQFNRSSGFYSGFFNTIWGNNNGWGGNKDVADMFFSNNLMKLFLSPFSVGVTSFTSPYLATVDKMFKQMVEYNQNMFSFFSNEMKNSELDWNAISKEYKETVEYRFEATKAIVDNIAQTMEKQQKHSVEAHKKMVEEITHELNSVMKRNQKFWAYMVQMNQAATNNEKKGKENGQNHNHSETKKRTHGTLVS